MTENPIQKLEYYQLKEAQKTMVARVVLLTVIIGMLGLNMWLTQRNYEDLVINLNQTRIEQDQLHDSTTARLRTMEQQMEQLQATVDMLESEHGVTVALAR
jgi:cell division protein FtsB